ncbi:MAG TPA: response regulator [Polyangiaceae bacterium]|nr:response regulator [Polyangiaceae bacterium]
MRRPQSVLVVDDEPLLLGVVARALASEGYKVVTAPDAERALELLTRRGGEFSMLLSDVGLPGLSGAELVRRARAIEPALPALLMSADSKEALVRRGVLSADTELLSKPFAVPTLLAKVEQLLEPTSHTFQG